MIQPFRSFFKPLDPDLDPEDPCIYKTPASESETLLCRSMLTVGAKGRDIYCSVPIPHAWCVNRSSQFVNAELEIFETEGRSEILDKQLCVCVTQHQHPPKTAHC